MEEIVTKPSTGRGEHHSDCTCVLFNCAFLSPLLPHCSELSATGSPPLSLLMTFQTYRLISLSKLNAVTITSSFLSLYKMLLVNYKLLAFPCKWNCKSAICTFSSITCFVGLWNPWHNSEPLTVPTLPKFHGNCWLFKVINALFL